jgi:hypothetical protein
MNEPEKIRKLGPAGWVALAVLAGLLAASLWYAIHVWTALVFYSSRHDYDR